MAYSVTRVGGVGRPTMYREFVIDTAEDIASLPVSNIAPGSSAYCVGENARYFFNNSSVWVKANSGAEGPGSGIVHVVRSGGFGRPSSYREFVIDVPGDAVMLPTLGIAAGSTAFCIQNGAKYMFNNSGIWDAIETGGDDGGGTSGDGGSMVVTVRTSGGTDYADKTYDEIKAAIDGGTNVILVTKFNQDSWYYTLEEVVDPKVDGSIVFSRYSLSTDGYHLQKNGIAIKPDNTIATRSLIGSLVSPETGKPLRITIEIDSEDGITKRVSSSDIDDIGGLSWNNLPINIQVQYDNLDPEEYGMYDGAAIGTYGIYTLQEIYSYNDYDWDLDNPEQEEKVQYIRARFARRIYDSEGETNQIETITIEDKCGRFDYLENATITSNISGSYGGK